MMLRFNEQECRQLAALSGLPERGDFWNGVVPQFQSAQALVLIDASERCGWVWRLDNAHEEEGQRWWTVSVQQPQTGPISTRHDKARCLTFEEAIARAALLALNAKDH